MIIISIDIGREGAVVVLKENVLSAVYKMPLTPEGETDARVLLSIIKNNTLGETRLVFEKLNSFFGIGQSAIVGVSRESGIVEAVAQISELPYVKVNPRKWQNFMFANEKQIFKLVKSKKAEESDKLKLDTKKMAANKFCKEFPYYKKFPLITKRTGSLRDGIVDAALIALYLRQNNL